MNSTISPITWNTAETMVEKVVHSSLPILANTGKHKTVALEMKK